MTRGSGSLTGPADSPPPAAAAAEAAAEQELARLTAPLAAVRGQVGSVAVLAVAVVMTGAGAGLRLAAAPGAAGRAAAAACATLLAVRMAGPAIGKLRRQRHGDREPGWTAAAAVHGRSLAGRVPASTLAAAGRYLPVLGRGCPSAHLYVPRCAGTGAHTRLCQSAGMWMPGGRLLLIVGEHVAAVPVAVAVSLAHERGHRSGWTRRVFGVLHSARTGWGWAAVGAVSGWPGLLAAAAGFQVASVLALWAVEAVCDLGAARAEGRGAALAALAWVSATAAAHRREVPVGQRCTRCALAWLAGPSHPPLVLRRALIRALPGSTR